MGGISANLKRLKIKDRQHLGDWENRGLNRLNRGLGGLKVADIVVTLNLFATLP